LGLDNAEALEQYQHIKVISSAPYEKLFPLVKAVVHHGGVGTTAECIKAGIPFLICPILYPIGDQQFWGQLAYKKGIAIKPVPLRKLTEKILIDKVRELLKTEHLYSNSRQLAGKITKEDGVTNAVQLIEKGYC